MRTPRRRGRTVGPMSTQSQPPAPMTAGSGDVPAAGEISGWASFAGIMITIVAMMNIIYGIAAIDNAQFYVNDAKFVFADLKTFGWALLILGVIQFGAAISIFGGTEWGRWVGIGSAGVNAIAQLLFLPSAPWLSLSLFAIDILVVYALVAHGGRRNTFR